MTCWKCGYAAQRLVLPFSYPLASFYDAVYQLCIVDICVISQVFTGTCDRATSIVTYSVIENNVPLTLIRFSILRAVEALLLNKGGKAIYNPE